MVWSQVGGQLGSAIHGDATSPHETPTSAGWCWVVQPQGSTPSTMCRCNGTLSPWQLTYLPQPWGNCRASVQGEQTLPGYDTYSIAACRLQCEKEAVVRSCHCRMVHMPGEGCACCGGLPNTPLLLPRAASSSLHPMATAAKGHCFPILLHPTLTPITLQPLAPSQSPPHLLGSEHRRFPTPDLALLHRQ